MSLNITKHSEVFSSCPQVNPEDVSEIALLGYKTIINARPDNEGGHTQPSSADIKIAAEQAGLMYFYIPVVPNNIKNTDIDACASFIKGAPTPILGFCKTGMRATNLYNSALKTNNPDIHLSKQNWFMQKVSDFFKNKCLLTKLIRKIAFK
jgi:uncharacterized protein (TIGR01244 family)